MGYAVARAAEQRGASVTMVSGPVAIDPPPGVEIIPVETCRDMADAMLAQLDRADIIIKVAAVADYRPDTPENRKIKKQAGAKAMVLTLTENPDILKAIGQRKKPHQFLVGFAAETNDLESNALAKMEKKNLDMIAGNLVGGTDTGFQTDTNALTLFTRNGGKEAIPLMAKEDAAHKLLDAVVRHAG